MESKLLEHRLQQRDNLLNLIKTIQEEVKGNKLHLHTLNREKAELEDEMEGLSNRLKSILREKEILFSKLMSAERVLEELQHHN